MWKKIILDRIPNSKSLLTISKSGISFSAKFIKDNSLVEKEAIEFFDNPENEYQLGFSFLDELGKFGSLGIIKNNAKKTGFTCAGRSLNAGELINKKKILKKIQQDPIKQNRMFEIKKYKQDPNIYYVDLSPIFENTLDYALIDNLDHSIKGIYRYLNEAEEIIYIGRGNIKERARAEGRSQWGIRKIEYSIIDDYEQMQFWEDYHISRFLDQNGVKPLMNKIMGSGKVKAAEIIKETLAESLEKEPLLN